MLSEGAGAAIAVAVVGRLGRKMTVVVGDGGVDREGCAGGGVVGWWTGG